MLSKSNFLNSFQKYDPDRSPIINKGLFFIFLIGFFLAGLALSAKWLSIPLLWGLMAIIIILIRVELALYVFLIVTQALVLLSKPAFVLLLISWFLFIHREKPSFFFSTQGKVLFWLILGTMIFSGVFEGKGLLESLFSFRDLIQVVLDSAKFWANVLLFFVIVTIINTKKELRRFINFLLFLGFSLSVIGMIQLFFQIPIFPTIRMDPNAPMMLAAGIYGDPVAYGTQVAFLLMVSFAAFLSESVKRNKYYIIILILLLSFALLASLNRSAIFGIGIFLVLMIFLNKKAGFKFLIVLTVAVILISQSAVMNLFSQQMVSIKSNIVSQTGHFADRIESASAAIAVIKKAPAILLVGGGCNQYEKLVLPFLTSPTAIAAPSNTTAVAVFLIELGLPALILFLMILGITFRDLIQLQVAFKRSGDMEMYYLSQGMFASLMGMVTISLVNAIWFMELFWVNIALAVVIKKLSRTELTDS